ncbi:MAG TPA: hypothetical protein VFT59_06025 [Candidatus Saccharimonadales bacterium]|nr:hypothetical protein [Candidatus Saccharimonadales bacterium]
MSVANLPTGASVGQESLRLQNRFRHDIVTTVLQWIMMVPFAVGSIFVWWGIISALFAQRQFAGATALLWLGGVFPALRGWEVLKRAIAQREDKSFVEPLLVRSRLWGIFGITLFNVIANAFCALLVMWHHIFGVVRLSSQDKWMLILGGFWGLAVLLAARGDILTRPAAIFTWAVGWRTLPILVVALIPVLVALNLYETDEPLMPIASSVGMVLIAGQAFLLLLVERLDVSRRLKITPEDERLQSSRNRAGWSLLGETLNFGAGAVLVIALAVAASTV